jgi:glycerol-3-phosphate cytidylyltransferase
MKKGFACGVFDFYHPGHVLMLKECRENCDHLTVAINRAEAFSTDINPGKRQPFFTPEERKMIIESVRYVDEVIFYNSEEELTKIMESGGYQIRFLGDDYRGKPITAPEAIKEKHYIDRSHGYSTTALLEKIKMWLKSDR